jgi:hypothetical protein
MLSNEKPVPAFLFANKVCSVVLYCSGSDWQVDVNPITESQKELLDTYCREHGIVKWFATSAKDDTNISLHAHHSHLC